MMPIDFRCWCERANLGIC